jgi:hypothetical protein
MTLAIVNARVRTDNPGQPWASGIGVEGDRFVAVASSAEVAKLISESTRVINANGRLVRNPSGTIERGGRADFLVAIAGATTLDSDTPKSDVILQVDAGEIVLDRTDE